MHQGRSLQHLRRLGIRADQGLSLSSEQNLTWDEQGVSRAAEGGSLFLPPRLQLPRAKNGKQEQQGFSTTLHGSSHKLAPIVVIAQLSSASMGILEATEQ